MKVLWWLGSWVCSLEFSHKFQNLSFSLGSCFYLFWAHFFKSCFSSSSRFNSPKENFFLTF